MGLIAVGCSSLRPTRPQMLASGLPGYVEAPELYREYGFRVWVKGSGFMGFGFPVNSNTKAKKEATCISFLFAPSYKHTLLSLASAVGTVHVVSIPEPGCFGLGLGFSA